MMGLYTIALLKTDLEVYFDLQNNDYSKLLIKTNNFSFESPIVIKEFKGQELLIEFDTRLKEMVSQFDEDEGPCTCIYSYFISENPLEIEYLYLDEKQKEYNLITVDREYIPIFSIVRKSFRELKNVSFSSLFV